MAGHRAFDNPLDVELAAYLRHRFVRALVPHHRSAGNHFQSSDLGQIDNQGFRDPVSEVLLVGIAGKIPQRKDGDGIDRRRTRQTHVDGGG